jgi:hypothetical protein
MIGLALARGGEAPAAAGQRAAPGFAGSPGRRG